MTRPAWLVPRSERFRQLVSLKIVPNGGRRGGRRACRVRVRGGLRGDVPGGVADHQH
ncbi:MAG TPA: hypothetical protein VGS06_33090 [Streptosporangiaceae bacterium]|nr:hypothetical protein [Streptosporangiaceae bacterium]